MPKQSMSLTLRHLQWICKDKSDAMLSLENKNVTPTLTALQIIFRIKIKEYKRLRNTLQVYFKRDQQKKLI